MDYKNIQELIKTVSESILTSFEIETEGIRIMMEKKEQQVVIEKTPLNAAPLERVAKEILTREDVASKEVYLEKLEKDIAITTENAEKAIPKENLFVVKSPIVGTMYSSPSAESKNFVKVGTKVKVGDTLCILEAMKLMNEIESEVDGEVVEVLVSNEDMVEYGQPLFKIIEN
ncbi:acetyl-CoA carboxylase biotin carboxyl carrier protein [Clostridium sp. CM028]|uniref:acetyl-CoA carboxylase biotin carboxyl carrier protein n=1 Tax=unclassified Clostridium TaxID=2614128 RepID=UPI001C0DA4C5|nr:MULTISPECIES: acetyl-CoA carboxylase biotin carboxyl carrier protein [unclassified Clostridium]MBU3091088.1 acetyl-CoA carboxylase biotin carboxyl carrier protein [Clostridium sp. CF011]MBW9144930.1 acetyl-CoA carboxylase biotin carboxyl carrier protein [Clostridium sp. CM027]MBW9148651.1 acetyl-CoA carboxylase biotin carboxyl carrier protein [Clostridium sp. CM028]UVE40069.1 acetyl-CoA carboxylase biotin carboxyl carrier protein [Clostridium sp. CM027]WAG68994.1 acetyl-CoA carboxylase biot